MNVEFHEDAIAEVDLHAAWYDDNQTGLSREYLGAIDRASRLIAERPRRWPLSPLQAARRRGVRYLHLERFPFTVAFVATGIRIYVIAVAHMSRRPGYWIGRLRSH